MSSKKDKCLRRLEGEQRGAEAGLVIRQSFPGQPFAEAWRAMHGDLPIPTDRQFELMPAKCKAVDELEAGYYQV